MELGDLLSQFNKNEFNALKELVKQLENIFKEDEMLLEYFFKKINLSQDLDTGKTYLEGLYYEQKMRQNQTEKLLKKVEASVKKKFNLKIFRNMVTTLTREINLFKKFSERKSLRHSGKYKEEVLYNNKNRRSASKKQIGPNNADHQVIEFGTGGTL
jgi:peptide methionine sulfoxide reductase MsrA